jgi:hypothetical protein
MPRSRTMSKKFEYHGDLAVTPLAEILATIDRYRVPGIVNVSADGRARRIVVEDGSVIFAASNEKDLGLAAYLLHLGALDAETASEVEARQTRDGLKIGQVLLQMGVMTPERLNAAIAGQVREILLGAMEWESGDVVFEIGARRTADFVRMEFPLPDVILEGIRRAANVKRLIQRLGSAQAILEKTPGAALDRFSAPERAFFDSVDGKTPLQRLCSRGPGGLAENARLLYAFFCLGLLHRARTMSSGGKKIQYKTEGGSLGK